MNIELDGLQDVGHMLRLVDGRQLRPLVRQNMRDATAAAMPEVAAELKRFFETNVIPRKVRGDSHRLPVGIRSDARREPQHADQ